MLHTARRSSTGRKARAADKRQHWSATPAAITLWTTYGDPRTNATPADSHTKAIYGSSRTKLRHPSRAGDPTPRIWEMFAASSAKQSVCGRMFVGVWRGGPTLTRSN